MRMKGWAFQGDWLWPNKKKDLWIIKAAVQQWHGPSEDKELRVHARIQAEAREKSFVKGDCTFSLTQKGLIDAS